MKYQKTLTSIIIMDNRANWNILPRGGAQLVTMWMPNVINKNNTNKAWQIGCQSFRWYHFQGIVVIISVIIFLQVSCVTTYPKQDRCIYFGYLTSCLSCLDPFVFLLTKTFTLLSSNILNSRLPSWNASSELWYLRF